jgi:hypothetical protein
MFGEEYKLCYYDPSANMFFDIQMRNNLHKLKSCRIMYIISNHLTCNDIQILYSNRYYIWLISEKFSHIVTCRLKAGILEPALFPRQRTRKTFTTQRINGNVA